MLIQDTAQYNVAELDCRRPFPEPARRVTLELQGWLRGQVQIFRDAFDGVHRQLELGVSAHQPDNCRRERHRVGQD